MLARLGQMNHEIRGALELYGDVDYDYDYDYDSDNDNEEADAVNNRNLGTPSCSGYPYLRDSQRFPGVISQSNDILKRLAGAIP